MSSREIDDCRSCGTKEKMKPTFVVLQCQNCASTERVPWNAYLKLKNIELEAV
jgi:hypothetical protein